MVRNFAVLTGLFLFGMIALFIAGFASNAVGLLMLGMLCAMPLFMLFLGATLGRASNELTISRKNAVQQVTTRVRGGQVQRVSETMN